MSLPPLPVSKNHIISVEVSYISEKQAAEYGQACRAAAMEEAAQICDERANNENDAQWCADRIRSLK